MAESVLQGEIDRVFQRLGVTGQAAALLMIVFGILVIAFPHLVAILLGIYLIVVGLLQLLGSLEASRARVPPAAPPYTPPPSPPLYP